MATKARPLAIVTGASTGIGFELAKIFADKGYDLVIAADEPLINEAAHSLQGTGVNVTPIQADLATVEGVDAVLQGVSGRPVAVLAANAGRGLGRGFLEQEFSAIRQVIDTNITGTLYLLQQIARQMRAAGEGRILVTGSIAGFLPGTFQAVYNGTKAFIDSFSAALRNELKDTGVTVTCLMPGPTETEFFRRADMMDTEVGTADKQPAAEVAQVGFDALMKGEADIVAGWKNKLQVAAAHVLPTGVLSEMHRKQAEPGTAKKH